jgi:hypothetical protein
MSAVTTKVWESAVGKAEEKGGTVELVAELVCWTMHGETPLVKVRAALGGIGLKGEDYAPDFRPRNVFARVGEKLEKGGRIITELKSEGATSHLHFQLNLAKKEQAEEAAVPASPVGTGDTPVVGADVPAVSDSVAEPAARVSFPFETIISVGRTTGDINCANAELAEHIRAEMGRICSLRTANDITQIVQKIFTQYAKDNPDADLFPVRDGGAIYMVLAKHQDLLDRVQSFMDAVGGTFRRFPIPMGTKQGDASVKDTIEQGMENHLRQLDRDIESLDEASKKGTIEKAASRVAESRLKIDCYATFLGLAQEGLRNKLTAAEGRLKMKVKELLEGGQVEESAATPAE